MSYYARANLLATGGQVDFTFGFPYLSRAFIKVYRIDSGTGEPFLFESWNWNHASSIHFTGAPAYDGEVIRIQRVTPATPLVDFVSGNMMQESVLDTSYLHSLHMVQEFLDNASDTLKLNAANEWDARGFTFTNVLGAEVFENILTSHNGTNLPLRPQLNFNDTETVTFSVENNSGHSRIDISATVPIPDVQEALTDLTANAITDNADETTLATLTIPADTMGTSKRLEVSGLFTYQNNSGSSQYVEFTVYFGGQKIGTHQFQLADAGVNVHHLRVTASIQNLDSTNAQMVFSTAQTMGGVSQTGGFELGGTLAVDTTVDVDVVIKAQLLDVTTLQVILHRGTKAQIL